jgi:hypothetical protein
VINREKSPEITGFAKFLTNFQSQNSIKRPKEMMMIIYILMSVVLFKASKAETCQIAWPMGYYTPAPCRTCSATFNVGIPPPTPLYTFTLQPPTLTACEVNEIERLCVDRINMYRSGKLVFSDGTKDTGLGTPVPLQYIKPMDQCHSGKS